MATAIGIDVGGTHLRAAVVAADGRVGPVLREPTPAHEPEHLVTHLRDVIARLDSSLPVGIGFAGLISRDGVVAYGPNVDVRDLRLGDLLGATVLNDATAAALGEARFGAGEGADDLVMVTLGTGVGGGAIIDGRPLLGARGFAGEFGHVIVEDGGVTCGCGTRGCLEAYASGSALQAAAEAEGLVFEAIGEAALAGDEQALQIGRAHV